MEIKWKIDKLLSKGKGRQLLWVIILSVLIVVIAAIISKYVFADGVLSWKDLVSSFINNGYNIEPGEHYLFRMVFAFLSAFVFSALLISTLTNIIDNITTSVSDGTRRYKLSNHILILGNGNDFARIISELQKKNKQIVVLSEVKPDLSDADDVIYYHGRYYDEKELISAHPETADYIFILGDIDNDIHDIRSIQALKGIIKLTGNIRHDIHCVVSVNQQFSSEVFRYSRFKECGMSSHLLLDIVNEYEYYAEQLLVETDFLPIIKKEDDNAAHVVIIGSNPIAEAVAYEAAHICHYPDFAENKNRTIITLLDSGVKSSYNRMLSAHPQLFEMSHYRYIHDNGEEYIHTPNTSYDFLDIEWHFVEAESNSAMAKAYLLAIANQNDCKSCIAVCNIADNVGIENVLHLPKEVYSKSTIAVYSNIGVDFLSMAEKTGQYHRVKIFGPANPLTNDPLFEHRFERGKRVNHFYEEWYGEKGQLSIDESWYKKSEADKSSSIFCAISLPLRKKCFSMDDKYALSEAEHRRWVMSALILGYKPGPETKKENFVHKDIVPFDALTKEEQQKDELFIRHIDDILS